MNRNVLLLSSVTFLITWQCTGLFRKYALRRGLLDLPNARSSHRLPTPRGGGVVIAAITLVSFFVLGVFGALTWAQVVGLVGGGGVIAIIGFADDRGHVAARWRLLSHFSAAVWLLVWLDGLPEIAIFGRNIVLGWSSPILGVLYVVWLLNLVNFMDGIDGIAAIEMITVCFGGAGTALLAVPGTLLWAPPVIIAVSALGFLTWNWPPARIFMGDVGSGYLGYVVAALSIMAAHRAPWLLWSWVILLGIFVVDATVTLITRVVRGQQFYEAHRTHAYQHLAQRWHGHRPVTMAVAVVNVLWLLPIALLVAIRRLDGLFGVVVAYLPLLLVARWVKAGQSHTS